VCSRTLERVYVYVRVRMLTHLGHEESFESMRLIFEEPLVEGGVGVVSFELLQLGR
jgi:hypothetical protein